MQGKIYGFDHEPSKFYYKIKNWCSKFQQHVYSCATWSFFFIVVFKKKMFYIFNTTSYNLMHFNNFGTLYELTLVVRLQSEMT